MTSDGTRAESPRGGEDLVDESLVEGRLSDRAVSVILAMGANLGQRRTNIESALNRLAEEPGVEVVRVSSLRETAPVGGPPQGRFLNGVAEIRTSLPPRDFLDLLHRVESQLGRVRRVRNGPRLIDLDILFYGDAELDEAGLQIPHPRILERSFVLEPLAELVPDRLHPVTGRTAAAHWSDFQARDS